MTFICVEGKDIGRLNFVNNSCFGDRLSSPVNQKRSREREEDKRDENIQETFQLNCLVASLFFSCILFRSTMINNNKREDGISNKKENTNIKATLRKLPREMFFF